jgi:cell division septum initiation protein DivIVA
VRPADTRTAVSQRREKIVKEIMKQYLRNKLERLIVWALERCLAQQASVLTQEIKFLKDRADQFEQAAKQVEAVHRRCIIRMDERSSKLRAVNMCGPTSGQTAVGNQQTTLLQNMTNQAQQVFGNSSQVFNDLVSAFPL